MHKIITLLLFLFATTAFGQNITLKGKITDDQNFPLESATVYLTSVQDSTIIDYTITGKSGNWELKTRKLTKPVFLKVSYIGLADHRQEIANIESDKDFGTIKLADKSTELNELVIENEIPPIRIKKDTLEFNAASFKVRPDANVKTLLKQLPGVEIDEEGKITVNGKEVNQILVNGKPFFDKDGKIALDNLPAEIINKVQVTDTKTKKEEATGKDAAGNNASINLTIDEDKNKGFFGRFLGGYGSDKRYESNVLMNYFKGDRKLSLLASSNNINTTGFSMDEVFDSMNGGRNYSIYTSSDGSFGINGMRFGGGNGITRTNIFGLTYADEWFKDFDPNINYFYTDADTDNNSKSRSKTFLTTDDPNVEKSLITESNSRTDNYKFAHNLNTEFEFKIDSTSTVYFAPKFTKAGADTKSSSANKTWDQDSKLLNESSGNSKSDSDNNAFVSNFNYNKTFNKRGRSLNIDFSNENKVDDSNTYTNSSTYFYEDTDGDGIDETTSDIRNQLVKNRLVTDTYRGSIELSEPMRDSLTVNIGVNYSKATTVNNREGYNYDDFTGGYTDIYDELTNYISGDESNINPYAGVNINKKKYSFGFSAGTSVRNFNNFGAYMRTDYTVNKNYILPSANGHVRLKFGKSAGLYLNYDYSVRLPSPNQILPIEDLSNPLYTTIGNKNLNPAKSHSVYMNFNNYDFASKSGIFFYGGGNYMESDIISITNIAANAKQTTTYGNLGGIINSWFGGSWSKHIKTEGAHSYRINLSLNGGFDLDKGVTNGEVYQARTYRGGPKIGFNYDYGELLNINPIYSFEYTETHYTNYSTDFTSNFVHKAGLQTTSYWPKHIVFGNDFTYTYNSNLSEGFKKDFFLWNTSLGYNFLNNKMMFKVKVYDLLNQNQGTSRYISPTAIYDTQNTVLKRYIMFTLSVKIDKFGTKKESNDNENRFWFF